MKGPTRGRNVSKKNVQSFKRRQAHKHRMTSILRRRAAAGPHPQQRGVAVDIDLMGCAVDLQHESRGCLSVAAADRTQPADLNSAGRLRASMDACRLRTNGDD